MLINDGALNLLAERTVIRRGPVNQIEEVITKPFCNPLYNNCACRHLPVISNPVRKRAITLRCADPRPAHARSRNAEFRLVLREVDIIAYDLSIVHCRVRLPTFVRCFRTGPCFRRHSGLKSFTPLLHLLAIFHHIPPQSSSSFAPQLDVRSGKRSELALSTAAPSRHLR